MIFLLKEKKKERKRNSLERIVLNGLINNAIVFKMKADIDGGKLERSLNFAPAIKEHDSVRTTPTCSERIFCRA